MRRSYIWRVVVAGFNSYLLMKTFFVVCVWMTNVIIVTLFFFVIFVIWLYIRSVMAFFIFSRVSGYVVVVCSFFFGLWIVFFVLIRVAFLNRLAMGIGFMWYVLYGFLKFVLLISCFWSLSRVLIIFYLFVGN